MTTIAARIEDTILVVILLLIGGTAAAASFTHVHDVTVAHGQPDWIGWANATVLELISIAVGLEIRRRRRVGVPVGGFTLTTLAVAVVLSLAAQVAEAERTAWGWIVAALPAAAFLALVKIVLSRPVVPDSSPASEDEASSTADGSASQQPAPPPELNPVTPTRDTPIYPVPVRDEPVRVIPDVMPPIPADLLHAARDAADQHQQHTGRPISRDALRSQLRVSNATAGDLIRLLRQTQLEPVPAVPASSNGRPHPS